MVQGALLRFRAADRRADGMGDARPSYQCPRTGRGVAGARQGRGREDGGESTRDGRPPRLLSFPAGLFHPLGCQASKARITGCRRPVLVPTGPAGASRRLRARQPAGTASPLRRWSPPVGAPHEGDMRIIREVEGGGDKFEPASANQSSVRQIRRRFYPLETERQVVFSCAAPPADEAREPRVR